MKVEPRSQLKRPGVADQSWGKRSAKLLLSAKGTAALILVLTLVNGNAAAQPENACLLTANTVLRSCRRAAQSDFWLAQAKCDNVTEPAARERCRRHARADLKDARQTCVEQNDARLAACERLGGAPYDPVINPSNFVARVDNPY